MGPSVAAERGDDKGVCVKSCTYMCSATCRGPRVYGSLSGSSDADLHLFSVSYPRPALFHEASRRPAARWGLPAPSPRHGRGVWGGRKEGEAPRETVPFPLPFPCAFLVLSLFLSSPHLSFLLPIPLFSLFPKKKKKSGTMSAYSCLAGVPLVCRRKLCHTSTLKIPTIIAC